MTLLANDKSKISFQKFAHTRTMIDTPQQNANLSQKRKPEMLNKRHCGWKTPGGRLHPAVILEMRKNIRWNHQ